MIVDSIIKIKPFRLVLGCITDRDNQGEVTVSLRSDYQVPFSGPPRQVVKSCHGSQGSQESGAILVGDMSRTKEMTGAAKVRSVPSTAEKR